MSSSDEDVDIALIDVEDARPRHVREVVLGQREVGRKSKRASSEDSVEVVSDSSDEPAADPAEDKFNPSVVFASTSFAQEWIKKDSQAAEKFLNTRMITCLVCNKHNIDTRSNLSGAIKSHAAGKNHKERAQGVVARPPGPSILDKLMVAAEKAHVTRRSEVRSHGIHMRALHSANASIFASHNAVPSLYSHDMILSAQAAEKAGTPVVQGGTVRRNIPLATLLLDVEMKLTIKDQFLCLLVDGASCRLLNRSKATALMAFNSNWPSPLLLDVIFDDEASTADQLAVSIRQVLRRFGIKLHTHVTGIVGDNAAINDKLARNLGIPRLKCIAHALHLIFKVITKHFPHFTTIVRGMHRSLTAGGGDQTQARSSRSRHQVFQAIGARESLEQPLCSWGLLHGGER